MVSCNWQSNVSDFCLAPDVMCATCRDAMALLHSRIRRVIYRHRDGVYGVLGSRMLMHEIPALNHHYEVCCFQSDRRVMM